MPTILSLRKIHQGVEYFDKLNRSRLESSPATKNHQVLGDSEDESDANIFSVPEYETGQQSPPHIQLKLMPRQPQQGNADSVLVENNFDTTSVTLRSKFSAVCNCSVEVNNWNSSRRLNLELLSNFLTRVDYPSFGRRSLNYRWW